MNQMNATVAAVLTTLRMPPVTPPKNVPDQYVSQTSNARGMKKAALARILMVHGVSFTR